MATLDIGRRCIGDGHPTYFIADISANHDGELERAIALIHLAAEAGADAAKFQNFRAAHIVSERGFASLRTQMSHQAKWNKSVYRVYEEASLPWEWTETLKKECDNAGIEYFSTPYDFDAVDMLDPYVAVFKIGSGDITWPDMLRKIASKRKPVLLATGASDIGEVQRAVAVLTDYNLQVGIMQCNTNYTGSLENFKHIHLNVLRTYREMFPGAVLGLSDHTPGHATVLGAIALGGRVIEKHFTDDPLRTGPDHPFSMSPATWREMVSRSRELELALGEGRKFVAGNEKETVVVQRRCLRAARDLKSGQTICSDCVVALRPAPLDAISPLDAEKIVGMRLRADVPAGEYLRWTMMEGRAPDGKP
jgi:sialic acid synthase SpsE